MKVITAERPKRLRDILMSAGYEEIASLTVWGETLWVGKDFMQDLELSTLPKILNKTNSGGRPETPTS